MRPFRLALTALLATLVAACNPAEPPAGANGEADDAAISAPAAAPEAEEVYAPATEAVEDAVDEETAAPEAAEGQPVEESAGTDGNGAGSKDIILATPGQPSAARESWRFREGAHFRAFPTAQGTSSPAGKIEVAEIFWYGCPHCYNLEPLIKDWAAKLPPDVSFVRIPVMWNPTNEIHARVFYTAAALDKVEAIDQAMFRAIHVDNRMLTEEDEIRKLFEQHGVSAEEFNRTFRSFGVDSQLRRARELTQKYRVKSVPILVVNGKYATEGPELRTQQDLLAVAGELVEREREGGAGRG